MWWNSYRCSSLPTLTTLNSKGCLLLFLILFLSPTLFCLFGSMKTLLTHVFDRAAAFNFPKKLPEGAASGGGQEVNHMIQSARLHFVSPATLCPPLPFKIVGCRFPVLVLLSFKFDLLCVYVGFFFFFWLSAVIYVSVKVFVYLLIRNIKPRLFLSRVFGMTFLTAFGHSPWCYFCFTSAGLLCVFCFFMGFFSYLTNKNASTRPRLLFLQPATRPNISLGYHGNEPRGPYLRSSWRTHSLSASVCLWKLALKCTMYIHTFSISESKGLFPDIVLKWLLLLLLLFYWWLVFFSFYIKRESKLYLFLIIRMFLFVFLISLMGVIIIGSVFRLSDTFSLFPPPHQDLNEELF